MKTCFFADIAPKKKFYIEPSEESEVPQAPEVSASVPVPEAAGNSGQAAQVGDMNAMMAAILGNAAMQQYQNQQQQQQQQQQQYQPLIAPLTDILTADDVAPLLEDSDVVNRLLPHLPEGQQNLEELRRTIRSPQFRSTLRTLTSALLSDNYNTVMANFGLDPASGSDALAQGNPILAFLQAIQAQADSTQGSASNGASKE